MFEKYAPQLAPTQENAPSRCLWIKKLEWRMPTTRGPNTWMSSDQAQILHALLIIIVLSSLIKTLNESLSISLVDNGKGNQGPYKSQQG